MNVICNNSNRLQVSEINEDFFFLKLNCRLYWVRTAEKPDKIISQSQKA